MVPTWSQKLSQIKPRWGPEAPKWSQNDGEKTEKKRQRNNKMGGLNFCPPIPAENGANMPHTTKEASKTAPRRAQDGPRRFQKRPGCPRWLKTLPNLPQTPPDLDFGATRPGF